MRYVTLFPVLVLALGCSSLSDKFKGRVFLDSTTHKDDPPSWVKDTKISWEEDKKVLLKASHSVRGDERVNGCFDLSRLDAKEALLSEIANDIKGSLDNANQSLSESAEVILGKVRSGEFSGRITGLRFTDQYFERYFVAGVERVDCHSLGEIHENDYDRIKRNVVHKVAEADPRLKEAITKKQIDFFAPRAPASGLPEGENVEPSPKPETQAKRD